MSSTISGPSDGAAASRLSGLVVVVCQANVCRSPLAAHILDRAWSMSAATAGLRVVSAGLRVAEGADQCALAATMVDPGDIDASAHSARTLDADALRSAALVLTATAAQRAFVIRSDVSLRSRAFTLRQFEALLRRPALASSPPPVSSVAELLQRVEAGRGTAFPPRYPTGLLAPAEQRSLDREDIADGHLLGARAHHRALEETLRSSRAIAGAVGRLADPRSTAPQSSSVRRNSNR